MTNPSPPFDGPCALCGTDSPHQDHEAAPKLSRRAALSAAGATSAFIGGTLAAASSAHASSHGIQDIPTDEYVVEAGWLLVEENGVHELMRDASVLVSGDRIAKIAEGRIAGDYKRIDAHKHLVTPGFISGHTHACTATPTRGLIENGRRPNNRRPQELVEQLDDGDLDKLTAYNVAELLRGGTTTHVEMSLSLRQAQSYVRVAEAWGVRGYPGGMIPGTARLGPIWARTDDQVLLDSEEGTLAEVAANLAFAKEKMGSADGRINPMITPHATDTHTPATMAAVAAAAKELGTGLHIHLSQSSVETERVKRMWGMTPTQWLDSFGLLDGTVFGAHMGGLDWDIDPAILIERGVVLAHCPSAGGAGGFSQNYPEALAAGMDVNIGIDTHSNDYLENLKLAVLYGQARYDLMKDGAVAVKRPTAWTAIRNATTVPAAALRRSDIGRIVEGAKADIVAIDVSGPLVGSGALPPEPLNNLLYANGMMVRHVITDGLVQVFDGHLVVDDESQVIAEGGQVMGAIYEQLQAEGWFTPLPRE
ncbi:MAG: amidohydrolase family protein [Rhodospirillaceae bacterium]|jgi:5-methylthioadenosine/S-adenosylhomocysteine deaminase|nr:amidohydrolase family protein [Rhodospirillaceae bacterium]MBT5242548.1 amidohydrolase family protein [Rhodospirillaceae bacterium]MBT5565578.1 amidohydrolase family protein [Rhodospirillaceae bacterium]MBT6088347.1 amidohydrolase family protein [Rhodospirillaceae bacterium]